MDMMRDKIAGALYGQAFGDAMGMPAELWGKKRTFEYFKGPITDLVDGPKSNPVAFNYTKGQFTDDTSQSLVLLDSLAATDFVPQPKDIAERMLVWAEEWDAWKNNILGPTTKVALASFKEGKSAKAFTDKALSNGSAMRIGPVGALFHPDDKKKLVDFVYHVSEATHTSDVTIAGAAMIAEGVASAIVHSDFEKVLEDIYAVEPIGYERGAETFSPRLAERLKIGIQFARELKGQDRLFLDRIYAVVGAGVPIIESVPAAISIAYYAQDPEKCGYLCANLGGDTDTIGAMATSICGAFTGASRLTEEHRHLLETANGIHFDHYVDILMKGREKLK